MLKKDRLKRKIRIRSKIFGTKLRPRISVFRSNKFIYAQAINDEKGLTLAASSGKEAKLVGATLGEKLTKAKIKTVVFDRSGYQYHGRVQALADGLREKGVQF